jgi:DNA ligase (NAD+)
MTTTSDRIKELEEKIQKYSQAYYDSTPVLSDQAFDKLIAELRQLDSHHPLLHKTSSGYVTKAEHLTKYKHPFHVGSLDKIKFQDIRSNGVTWNNGPQVASIKIDGGSGTAEYNLGKLVRVLSRGDGEEGLDITNNVIRGGSLPTSIPDQRHLYIRGEIAITWEDFQGMEASHPRNKACGLSQSITNDPNEIVKLKFVTYHIFNFEGTKLEMLKTLEDNGFIVVPFKVFNSFAEYVAAVENGSYCVTKDNVLKNGHHLPCDGTVLTEISDAENQIAVKYDEETAETVINGFEWHMSRTGRLVPIALLQPVNLAGAMIGRVTCNNVSFLKEMGLYPGVKVKICRANEIIPQIIETLP